MISQNVLNLVDTGMVGTLGDAALAAVGTGSFVNFMAMAFVMGFSSGVQAMAARRVGEGREEEAAVPLNGALVVALVFGFGGSLLLFNLAPLFFPYVNSDPEVHRQAIPYLQARLCAMAAVGMNFSFRGFWNGINRSTLYMRTIVVMHVVNIFLNWVFIFGNLGAPALGATGAGVASAIATWAGTFYYFFLGIRHGRSKGFLRRLPEAEGFRTLVRLSVPTGVQQLFFSAGFTALFWILGQVSTQATAAANVLLNIALVAILPGLALGFAAASLVGQALGRGDPDDAKQWGWDVVKVAEVVLVSLAIPMLLLPDQLLGVFLHDQSTVDLARPALRIFACGIMLDGVGLVLQNAMLGAGAARQMMKITIFFQWGLFLPVAYLIGPVLGYGLLGVWACQAIYRAAQAAYLAAIWQRGRWAEIKV